MLRLSLLHNKKSRFGPRQPAPTRKLLWQTREPLESLPHTILCICIQHIHVWWQKIAQHRLYAVAPVACIELHATNHLSRIMLTDQLQLSAMHAQIAERMAAVKLRPWQDVGQELCNCSVAA